MSNNLLQEISQLSQNDYTTQLNEAKKLINRWEEKTPLLESLEGSDKVMMARLLENQLKQLLREANATNPGGANSEEWSGVALPLVRRIFMDIAAKDFVSIQTMNQPSGLVFYLDFKYGSSTKDGGIFSGDIYGNTSSSGTPTGGFYGDGRFGYTMPDKEADIASAAITVASATLADVQWNTDLSASVAGGEVFKVTFPITNLTRPDKAGVHSWRITGSSVGANANLPIYNFLVDGAGNKIFTPDVINDSTAVSASIFITGSAYSAENTHIFYAEQTDQSNRGDFEDRDSSVTNLDIPTVDVELRSEPIVAKTRKLKAVWSPEYAQDLNAYHALDAEAELTSMLSDMVSMEIDQEIISMLIQAGQTVNKEFWSAYVGRVYTGAYSTTTDEAWENDGAGGAARAESQSSWFSTLGTKIQKLSNQIFTKTLRGGANFIVCSPKVATILESIPGYNVDTNGDSLQFGMGVERVGTLANRFTVYKNPYMVGNDENVILLGFRGPQFLETGAVYAPYIPLITSPVVHDPNNFTPRKAVMTRYAKKVVRPEYYGVIFVKDLNVV